MAKKYPVNPVAKMVAPVHPADSVPRIGGGNSPQTATTSTKKRGRRKRLRDHQDTHPNGRRISREDCWDFHAVENALGLNTAILKELEITATRAAFSGLAVPTLEAIRRAVADGDAELACKLLTHTGVVPQAARIPSPMESESPESPELSAKKKLLGELVEMAIERAQDYGLPSDSIQLRPPRRARMVVEEELDPKEPPGGPDRAG